jgi:hypothetical protein
MLWDNPQPETYIPQSSLGVPRLTTKYPHRAPTAQQRGKASSAADNPHLGVQGSKWPSDTQSCATSQQCEPILASPTSRGDANRHPVSTYTRKGHDAQPRYAMSQLRDLRSYRIPYKKHGVHSSDVVDVDYFFSPIYYVWISRTTGEPVSERKQQEIKADLKSDLDYRGIHNTKILYHYWGWVPARRAAELRN